MDFNLVGWFVVGVGSAFLVCLIIPYTELFFVYYYVYNLKEVK